MENTVIYDLSSVPVESGFDFKKVMEYYKAENVLVYDSQGHNGRRADVPQIINNTLGTKVQDLRKHDGLLRKMKEQRDAIGK